VKPKKKMVIIADDSAITGDVAKNIAAVMGAVPFADWSATVISAKDFSPPMILSANAFLLGCEKPEPPDFMPVKELFKHINLAGRPCGVFSPHANAVKYLSGLVRDSEAAIGDPFIVNKGAPDGKKLKKWVGGIIGSKA